MRPFLLIAEWIMSESIDYACQIVLANDEEHAKSISYLVGKPSIERYVAISEIKENYRDYELLKRIAQSKEGDELYGTKLLMEDAVRLAYEYGLGGKPSREVVESE